MIGLPIVEPMTLQFGGKKTGPKKGTHHKKKSKKGGKKGKKAKKGTKKGKKH
jgi:hypothetical protein